MGLACGDNTTCIALRDYIIFIFSLSQLFMLYTAYHGFRRVKKDRYWIFGPVTNNRHAFSVLAVVLITSETSLLSILLASVAVKRDITAEACHVINFLYMFGKCGVATMFTAVLLFFLRAAEVKRHDAFKFRAVLSYRWFIAFCVFLVCYTIVTAIVFTPGVGPQVEVYHELPTDSGGVACFPLLVDNGRPVARVVNGLLFNITMIGPCIVALVTALIFVATCHRKASHTRMLVSLDLLMRSASLTRRNTLLETLHLQQICHVVNRIRRLSMVILAHLTIYGIFYTGIEVGMPHDVLFILHFPCATVGVLFNVLFCYYGLVDVMPGDDERVKEAAYHLQHNMIAIGSNPDLAEDENMW